MARTVTIEILGDSRGLEASLERAGLVAKGASDTIGDSFNSGSTKAGNALEKLGKKAEGMGIPFAAGLSTAGKHLDEATTKTGKLTSVMGELGKATLLAGGAMAVGVGVEAVKMGLQYESAQAKIQGATGQSTKAVKALTAAFGGTAGQFESSGMQMESAYAGVAGQLQATEGHALGTAEAMKVMSSATQLNTAVQGELASTTASLGAVMQAFHMSAGQAAGTADTLYNVSTRLDVPISSLATAIDKLHARLGTLSPTLSDMGGLMVSLGEHGVTGSRGIQVVNTAMTTLVGGSEKTDNVLKALGVNIFNSQGKFIGMSGVIAQLGPKLAGLSQQQQIFAEKTLFGAGAYQIMGSVIQSGVPAYQKATDAATKTGTAQQAAAIQAKTLRGEFDTAKAAVETLGGDLGLVLIPKLTAVAKTLAEGITWLTKHKEACMILGGVITSVLGAAVSVFAYQKATQFVTGTREMVKGLTTFGSSIAQTVPSILTKMGLIGSTSQTTAAAQLAANEEMEANNVALASSYGMTAGEIKAAGTGIVASADTTAAGVDAALGATGVGLVLVGVGVAAVELEQHWKTVMKGLEIAAQEMANAVIAALNKAMSVVEKLTLGLVHLGKIKELSGAGGTAGKEGNLNEPLSPNLQKAQNRAMGIGGSVGVESEILKFWESKGFSPAAAAGFAGNAQLESGDTPSDKGGGLYQQSGLGSAGAEQVAGLSVAGQSEEVLRRLSPSQIAQLKSAKNPAEAARFIEKEFEVPAGSRPGEPGYGTPEEGTAHLHQREQAAAEAYAHSGGGKASAGTGSGSSGISGLMNETSNAKAVSKEEKAKEKAQSKAESAAKTAATKAEAAAKKAAEALVKLGEKAEGLVKKYEANIQSSTPAAIERSLGVSTTAQTGKPVTRHGVRFGAGPTIPEMALHDAEAGSTGGKPMTQLTAALTKSASQSVAGKQEQALVNALNATHQKKLEELASKLVAAHKLALATLASEMVSTEETKLGEQLKVQATEQKDQTTQLEHTATDQLNVVKASQAQQTDAMKAAGQAIADATQSMSDSFSALTQSIEDQSKVMAAASNEVVTGIKDQTNIEVSILGERGLYGLNLIAQKEEVQLDEMKASYDQQIAQAQREDAQLAVNWQQVTALDEQTVDQDKAMADAQEASALAHVDAVTVAQDQKIQIAQEEVDRAQSHADQLIGNAELKVLAATGGGKQKEEAAAAKLHQAEGEAGMLVAGAEHHLKAEVNPAAEAAINAASNELTRTTESWSNAIKQAEQNLARAKGEGAAQLAQAQQNLTQIEDTAAQREAAKEREVSVTKEKATTQYAGSGLVVNQYGLDMNNAQANATELTWALTHQLPV